MSFSNPDDIRGLRAHEGYTEVTSDVKPVIIQQVEEVKPIKKMGRPSKNK